MMKPFLKRLSLSAMMIAMLALAALPLSAQPKTEEKTEQESDHAQRIPRVSRIDVIGNQVVSTNTVLNNMKTRPGQELNQQKINEDVKHLYGTGFFQDIRIDIEETQEGARLIVVVDEKPVVRHIFIEGHKIVKERDIRKDLNLVEGQVLDEYAINQGINKVKERYSNKGFRFVQVFQKVDIDRPRKEATVTITVEEGQKFRIQAVRFKGADSFKPRRLLKLMKTKPRNVLLLRFGTFKDEKFKEDLDRLVAFYQSQGFLDAKVTQEFEYDEQNGKITIDILVAEGKRYHTGRVDLKGVKIFHESDVWQILKLLPGSVFSQQGLSEDIQKIREFYHRYGYMNVQIQPDIKLNRETGKVDVSYDLVEGDLYFVDKVKIRGNTKTKDIVIRREIKIKPGEKFDGESINRSKQRLENLGYFEEVTYDTEQTPTPNRRDIVFQVKEKRTGELSFGAGISSIDQFIGFAEIAQRNFDLMNWPRFTGGGQSLSLKGRWGTITRDFELNFTEPYLFNKPISYGLDVYDTRTENRNVDFREERLGLGNTFSKAFTEFIRAGFGYRLERVDLFDLESDAPPDVLLFQGKSWLSRLKLFLSRDTRDNVFNPTRGWVGGVSGELIGTFLGGEEDFYIFQAHTTKYWSFKEGRHVIEWRMRAGVADELGSEKVPVYDRFFAGGYGTVRGYNFKRVSPIEAGSAIGGNTMAIINLEYTFPIAYLDNFKGAFFIDAGDVEADSYNIDIGEFRVSIGPGMKINTPIGPLAFYYGFPFVNRDTEDRNGRFEFSLSRSF